MISCAEHGSLQSDLICPKCYLDLQERLSRKRDLEREAFLLNQERERIYTAIQAHRKGDMGPAFVFVKDIQPIFTPEASAD